MSGWTEDKLFSSKKHDWETPQALFDALNEEFEFGLDTAASDHNAKCEHYFTDEDDALTKDWSGHGAAWCNPPYGHGVGKWVQKAVVEVQAGHVQRVVLLLRSTTDVKWFHDWAWPYCSEMIFVKGRMCFDKGDGESKPAVFPSIVLVIDDAFLGIEELMQSAPNISRVDINGEEI